MIVSITDQFANMKISVLGTHHVKGGIFIKYSGN